MNLIVPHDRADVTTDDNPGPFHGTALGRQPWEFVDEWIINFVVFNARVVALITIAIPVDENSQLHIVNFVSADHNMRGIERAYPTAIRSCAVEPHFETFDPEPITAIRIKGVVQLRHLPAMIGWIVQAADIEPER